MAIAPSLRVSVGVPPATVTASLMLSVKVTVLPAFRWPFAGVSAIELSVGVFVSICSVPDGLVTAPVRFAVAPAPPVTVAEFRLTALTARSEVFWPDATV